MFLRFNLFTIVWAMVILLLTLVSGVNRANLESSMSDKLVHALMFCILCVMMIIGFVKQYSSSFLKFNAEKSAVWICIFFGLLIEFIQYLLPYRSFSWHDVLADVIGTFIGLGMFYVIYKLKTT